jgi:excinuclease UvrABC nuclease subunit
MEPGLSHQRDYGKDKMLTNLYRHFDADGNLLYVGISLSALTRLYAHGKAAWYNDIKNVTIENYPTKRMALDAEKNAIKTEKPIHNIMHNKERTPSVMAKSTEKNRVRHAERARQLRKSRGAIPREESFSRTKPWEALGMSRRTWERRKKKEKEINYGRP